MIATRNVFFLYTLLFLYVVCCQNKIILILILIHDFQPIFNIVSKMLCLRGSAQTPLGGGAYSSPDPQMGNVESRPCRGTQRIVGPRAPRPHGR